MLLRLLYNIYILVAFHLSFNVQTFYPHSTLVHPNTYLNYCFFNLPDLSHSFIGLFTIWIHQSVISIHFMKLLTYLCNHMAQFFLYVGSYLLTLTFFVFVYSFSVLFHAQASHNKTRKFQVKFSFLLNSNFCCFNVLHLNSFYKEFLVFQVRIKTNPPSRAEK